MTLNLKTIGIGAAVILTLGLLVCKSCDIYQQRGVLLGELNAAKAQAKLIDAKAKREIAAQGAIILAKDAQISLLTTAVGHANNVIGQLQESYGSLEKQYQAANTCPEKLTIALTQIDNLKRTIVIDEDIIATQAKVIAAWSDKFAAQVAISLAWKSSHDIDHATLDKQADLISSLNTSLRISRLTGSVKSVAIVAASAYILLKVLKVI